MKLVFDVETTRFPDGNPYRPKAKLVSWAVLSEDLVGQVSYYTNADFLTQLREELRHATLLIGINLKFDIAWARREGVILPRGIRVWDCQVAEYCLSGQRNSFASMDELCLRYGIEGKQGGLEDYWNANIETTDIPRDVVLDYNTADTKRTWLIYENQLKDERMTPELHKLILLMGADLLVLQRMEENGLKYDTGRSLAEGERLNEELVQINLELDSYANNVRGFNWDSGDHLSAFLYGGNVVIDRCTETPSVYLSGERKGQEYIKRSWYTEEFRFEPIFKPLPRTEVAKSTPEAPLYQTNEPVLKQLRCTSARKRHIIELLLKRSELAKLVDTYFFKLPERIREMEWGETIHGTYNQVVARTGRLSSSAPNMQNNPEVVDRMFISRYAD